MHNLKELSKESIDNTIIRNQPLHQDKNRFSKRFYCASSKQFKSQKLNT